MSDPTTTTETTAERLARIRQAIDAGHFLAKADLRWLLEELSNLASHAQESIDARKNLATQAEALRKSDVRLRHALTLWLAVRGSNSEEFFKATAGLAAQTAQALNE